MTLPSLRRQYPQRVAVLLFLALVGYMGFLVYGQYHSQEALRDASIRYFLSEGEQRAAVAGYFLADRLADQQHLKESPELSHYYENLALGMSLEYGLGAALLATEEAFARKREQLHFNQQEIYSRLVYISVDGDKLIDVHPSGAFVGEHRNWPEFLAPERRQAIILQDSSASIDYLVFSTPYLFKGQYAGQILAWIETDLLYRNFIDSPVPDSVVLSTLLFGDRYIKVPDNGRLRIETATLPDPRRLQRNTIFSARVVARTGSPETVTGILTPMGEFPLAIATFLPEELGGGKSAPNRLVMVMTGLGFLILAGGVAVLRISMRNALLQARLEETAVRERIVAEKNASLRKLTTAVDQSANAIIITDAAGVVEYVNPFFTEMTDYHAEEILGRHFSMGWAGGEHGDAFRAMWEAINRGELWSGEFLNTKKGGEQFWERVILSPVKDEHGAISNFIAIKEDFTKRRQAEEEIRALNASLEQRVRERTVELERSNRELAQAYGDLKQAQSRILQQEKMASIGQLAAGVAHEINNPMGFIISNLNSLGKYLARVGEFIAFEGSALEGLAGHGDEEVGKAIAQVREQRKRLKVDFILEDIGQLIAESADGSQRVRKIVQSLRNFSHVDEVAYKEADINEGLESSLAIAWNEIKYKASVTKEYGELPRTVCNIGQLNQVFMNLLINAAGAIETQGEISVKTRADDGNIVIAISDTGCGIAPENLSRIFEPFFTTKEVGHGTGLGLSIVYDIIKQHNGRIEVESEPGRGTTFTIVLPVVRDRPAAVLGRDPKDPACPAEQADPGRRGVRPVPAPG